MKSIKSALHSRRDFLKRSTQVAASTTLLPTALNLMAMEEAAAMANPNDYKALVCIFLFGGNDYANTFVPYDNANYDLYSKIRGGGPMRTAGGIALAQSAVAPNLLKPAAGFALPNGRQYALHPSLTGIANLFNTGKAAALLNVGPLIMPLTRAQYDSADRKTYPVPAKLFSHNDQQSVWQSSSAEGSTVGWGGKIADVVFPFNFKPAFTGVSVTGHAVFLSGEKTVGYQIGTAGTVKIKAISEGLYGSSAARSVVAQLLQQSSTNLLENEYGKLHNRAITSEVDMSAALQSTPESLSAFSMFPSFNPLADQLKMVARIIGARSPIGIKRQVFFVSLGGFDMHDGLLPNHAVLLKYLDDAMVAFYKSTVALGLDKQVTTFTASDFGRTLTSNSDGSDHGWGGHHFIVGGAVQGQKFYGKAPPVSIGDTSAADDQFHIGQGRLLPTTSVDQYAATLARWFGVPGDGTAGTELASVLPNLKNFVGNPAYPVNLGFMG
jgi:uncharacterized protein (DUF1501 family)